MSQSNLLAMSSIDLDASPQYYGGLIDATMALHFAAAPDGAVKSFKVVLVCDDERVLNETHAVAVPTRETIVRRPGKKDSCVALFQNGNAKALLTFAAENCIVKKDLAAKALKHLAGEETMENLKAAYTTLMGTAAPDIEAVLSSEWLSGFFEVRGAIAPPKVKPPTPELAPEEEPPKKRRASKPRRGVVKYILPKHEKALIPLIQAAIGGGKIKRSSPCRLIFDAADIETFLEVVGRHVRARSDDLLAV